jgi:uncharacterized protein YehS (DUF1456 family)
MINNDVLRSIRYMLDLSDGKVVELIHLADAAAPVTKEEVQAMLKKDDEPGYVECSTKLLALFLDGLVFHRRGKDESRPPHWPACPQPGAGAPSRRPSHCSIRPQAHG